MGDKPSARDVQDGWWAEPHTHSDLTIIVNNFNCCTNCNGFEQREKVMKGNRERMLPIATLHPEHDYEFVLEKTGLTTPSQLCEPKNL